LSQPTQGTQVTFTGERLHEGSQLFGVDLARHHAAYEFAAARAGGLSVIDLGCGSGYGAAKLVESSASLVGLDRIPPDAHVRDAPVQWLRADLYGIPLAPASFDLVVSFQVIEHLEDPTVYLESIGRLLRPGAQAIITTPNILTSDRENPFHVHEYEADELAEQLRQHFGSVEMMGVGQSEPVARYQAQRLQRIRTITRLDPLRLRDKLPRALVEWLFGRFALLVRRGIQNSDDGLPDVSTRDFPIGTADAECIDLLAVCRDPRL
jgi:SAM-dependent methyltransferase